MDLVAYDGESKTLIVAECKWQDMSQAQENGALEKLRLAFASTKLAKRYPKVEFHVFSKKNLKQLAARESL